MKELVEYIKSCKHYFLNYINKYYRTEEVNNVLDKYNLRLEELCYRIKYNIALDKVFICKQCNKKVTYHKRYHYKDFCSQRCSVIYLNKSHNHIQNVKNTCIKKYGVDNYTKTKEYKDKTMNTCLAKYGTKSFPESTAFKTSQPRIQQKIYNTKKANNTFNASDQEEKAYKLLLTKFKEDDILRQYKSELYPYRCDFYIKSKDLYIEYNEYWTHGWYKHKCLGSFDKNNLEHIKLLHKWKLKRTKFFSNAIYTWTVLDVKKLETFKKNNLNYKIFWNLEEVKQFIGE